MNSNRGVYFLKLEIEQFRCFGEKQVLYLSNHKGNWCRWNILLGDNGTGKTSVLQALSAFEMEPVEAKSFENHYRPVIGKLIEDKSFRLNVYCTLFDEPIEMAKFGLTRYQSHQNSLLKDLICNGYGANRFMSLNSLSEGKTKNSDTLFDDDAKLINAEEWLLQLDYAANKESGVKAYAIQRRDKVKKILLDILPDINDIGFSVPTKENLKSSVQFHTPYGWVTIHQLSLGYKTMVAWVVDLAARMFERYPESENPLAEPAIVLVDEIDLHLHPKWQRKIFDYLSELFPKTQFIVTAHSPLVVQSAPKDANIILLRREGDHVVIDQNIESVKAWRLDQILTSDLFGIESARSPEIEKLMLERTALLQKKNLSEEEKKRLEELNKIAYNLPTAENSEDREAMEIIRKAADIIKNK